MNDFGFPLRPPNHPLYLNTEFVGHMFPTNRSTTSSASPSMCCGTRGCTTS